MAEAHPTHKFYRGDTWIIDGAAHMPDWTPLPLTNASIKWQLHNDAGSVLLDADDATLTLIDVDGGKFRLTILPAATVDIAPGSYRDQCRVIVPDVITSTQWYGIIEVTESYFEEPLAPPTP